MAIGSSVVSSIAVVGSTVDTLEKAKSGLFIAEQELGDVDLPLTLNLRCSKTLGLFRRFGGTYKFNPSALDTTDALTLGRFSASFNIDAVLGSTITRTELLAKSREFMGALLKATLLEALVDGSLE
jgi:hypothetical protein